MSWTTSHRRAIPLNIPAKQYQGKNLRKFPNILLISKSGKVFQKMQPSLTSSRWRVNSPEGVWGFVPACSQPGPGPGPEPHRLSAVQPQGPFPSLQSPSGSHRGRDAHPPSPLLRGAQRVSAKPRSSPPGPDTARHLRGRFSTGGGGQRPPAQLRPQHRLVPGGRGAAAVPPPGATARPRRDRCWPTGGGKTKTKPKNARGRPAIVERCVSRTGRSRCPGMRLCALAAAVGWAVSAVCVHGAGAKAAWKGLLQHAASSPKNVVAYRQLRRGPSRAGERAALAVNSEQGPPRDNGDVAGGISG